MENFEHLIPLMIAGFVMIVSGIVIVAILGYNSSKQDEWEKHSYTYEQDGKTYKVTGFARGDKDK